MEADELPPRAAEQGDGPSAASGLVAETSRVAVVGKSARRVRQDLRTDGKQRGAISVHATSPTRIRFRVLLPALIMKKREGLALLAFTTHPYRL
jgi:hypothetical protein